MKIALMLNPIPDKKWILAKQMGVNHAVTYTPLGYLADIFRAEKPWEFLPLLQLKNKFLDAGLDLIVLEGGLPFDKIKLGLKGRDEEIELVCSLIKNMGKVGIPVFSYNFMPKLGWVRTSTSTLTRGGALTTSFNYELIKDAPLTEFGKVYKKELWNNLTYFLKAVIPIAENAGVKLALHPDDPPIPCIRGIERILTNIDAFKKVFKIVPSECNGITFCQGCFSAMGVNIPQTIRLFGKSNKIFFVHFRDIRGDAHCFFETFQDDTQTNMFEAMKAYIDIGFKGPIRPDHTPTMEGEENIKPGYETLGRLFAVGYMKGIKDSLKQLRKDS